MRHTMGIIQTLLGNSSDGIIRKMKPLVVQINNLESSIKTLSDSEMRAKTAEYKARLDRGEEIDSLLPEAFALVREAAVRTVDMRHFDVQLIGGVVLHRGDIAEMKTGEGKTLVATLPAYLNALMGKGVHIVTVNDYLARRDSEWMGKIYKFLGLDVGLIVHGLDSAEKHIAYNADITYGTNNEYGFDYLRDNMVVYKHDMVQRALHYAIVDEVDSILVDEARTPLIISGAGDKSTDMYTTANKFVQRLERGPDVVKLSRMEMLESAQEEETGDYVVDEKAKTVALTSNGSKKAEEFFGVESLADVENMALNHHIIQALKANATMKRDRDYVVQNGEVLIVDEFTGRLMIGRRYSDGLHQAIEAKEGVKVERENRTLATITFQNYFRMYSKLAGMTGTAKTEEQEFQDIYSLNVIEVPTYKPMIRKDYNDVVYMTQEGKFRAVVEEIIQSHSTGQPVLVGTVSVEKSEYLSKLLKQRGIKHEVLNAKLHAKEADIVAQAGKLGTVTIATNMAGRGTDILLGGNPDFLTRRQMRALGYEDEIIEEATGHADTDDEVMLEARAKYSELFRDFKRETDAEHDKVVGLGGLAIIATERHESRRIDNQLRGRSGRQGDPGSSKFFISLEDDLMRLFGSERVKGMVARLSPNDDIPMDIGILSKQIEGAQKRVEGHNFDIRKHVLQYDDVMNKQRGIIYEQRRRVLLGEDIHQSIMDMLNSLISDSIDKYCHAHTPEAEWDINGLILYLKSLPLPVELESEGKHSREALLELFTAAADEAYEAKEAEIRDEGADMRELERVVLLRTVDTKWIDHIDAMDQLRQGIGLRAYGQRDPVLEYRKEGFDMFDDMVQSIREDTITMILRMKVNRVPDKREQISKPIEPVGDGGPKPRRIDDKPGRNSPCPCGSGKKYKNCCGKDE